MVKIFTEEFGLQSYLVNGVRTSRGHAKIALYQPLTLLDLVVYKKEQKTLQRISECKCEIPYKSITSDIRKSAVVMFWAELLNKTITDEGLEDREKYRFIRELLLELDGSTEGIENYPVRLAVGLCRYLGFEIESADTIADHMMVGNVIEEELCAYIDTVINQGVIEKTSNQLRRKALDSLMSYYNLHLDRFTKMKSTIILKQVFS